MACRVTSCSTRQGLSLKAPLTIGILTRDDGCCLSQGLSLLESRSPSQICFLQGCATQNEWWGDHAVSFQWSLPNPGWYGHGDDSAPRQGGDQMSFREPIQPENTGLLLATGCILKTYFSAPWVMASVVNSTLSSSAVHQSPPPNLNLEIIPSFLVSFFFPLCLRNNEISWVCHPSPDQQQVVTSD